MFTPLPGRTQLGVAPDTVVAIIESINAPNIAIPDVGTGATRAYLIGVRTPAGGYAIFCYLLLVELGRPILYISNPSEVSFEQYGMLEADAIQFAESMGFMLDNLNFRAQPPATQARMVHELPFFREPPPPTAPARHPTGAVPSIAPAQAESMQLARLLVAF